VRDVLEWVAASVAVLTLLAWYLSFLASRLDRLHTRVEAAMASLDTQLVRRAAACLDAAALLDPAAALFVADAAAQALAAGEGTAPAGLAGREEAENALGRAIRLTFADPPPGGRAGEALSADVLTGLVRAWERVQLARRFHNDAVAQAQRVRRKRVVRWFRLAGTAAAPVMFEIDDSLPPGLRT
jgi:hypothetical protein